MNKSFERQLTDGYTAAKVIDAGSKRLALATGAVAVAIPIIFAVVTARMVQPFDAPTSGAVIYYILFGFSVALYAVLHELIHGAVYKAMTKEKLTFGMSLTVIYCGVPNILVYRRTALLALLAPFVTFTVIFAGLLFIPAPPLYTFLMSLLLGIHIGGCSGDLYVAYLLLFRHRSPDILLSDSGPKQVIYNRK